MMAILFWVCVALIVYHGVVYPLVVLTWASALRALRPANICVAAAAAPEATVIVPAYNEARFITAKIANLAALAYPAGRLSIVLALDGCSDETASLARAAIAGSANPERFILKEFPRNRGKIAVINDEIQQALSEVIILTDVSALVEADALLGLVRHFADPKIGVVCPSYAIAGAGGETSYWSYQIAIKAAESEIAAPIGPHGAFYLFRRALWEPLARGTINDDFVMPMRMVMAGAGAVYDRTVAASELETASDEHDFKRRMRLGAGNIQQIGLLAGLANPRRPVLAFLFLSGKTLRGLVPLIAGIAILASIGAALEGSPVFGAILGAEIALFAGAALVGRVAPAHLPRPVAALSYAVRGLTAAALGACLYLAGSGMQVWNLSTLAKQNAEPK